MILNKRNSLERFIREQTLGPGINGYRYVDLEDKALIEKNLFTEHPINYQNEIIDIVPAAVYSTGILFPEDKSGSTREGVVLDNNEHLEQKDEAEEMDAQNDSLESDENGNGIELNQMFPNSMGLTCCLSEDGLKNDVLRFKVSFRYYRKLNKNDNPNFNQRYGLLIETDMRQLRRFLEDNNLSEFSINEVEHNSFLLIEGITSDRATELKNSLRQIQKRYAEELYDKTIKIKEFKNFNKKTCYLSNLKSSIYYELRNAELKPKTREALYGISQEIELIENISDHLKNLLDVSSGGYGLWQANKIDREIILKNVNFDESQRKLVFLYNKEYDNILVENPGGPESHSLNHIFKYDLDAEGKDFASISSNIQLSRDSRVPNNKIFIKFQLINTSTAFELDKDNSRYYSTFNEVVNRKSFFGTKISIDSGYLKPYTSKIFKPNNEGVYEEDITTRFVYNQFEDYAIGHGCSVKWSKDGSNTRVETEYMPDCETPDIEPVPRNKHDLAIEIEKEKYSSPLFLENSRSQEFKWLSSFSEVNDNKIIEGLLDFVEAYGKWIELKKKDEKYQGENELIANQELDKCAEDYMRMKANINNLLRGEMNKDNISAFRLMNSAMFMQLWHSVKTKGDELDSILNSNEFSSFDCKFYSLADDKLFSKRESAGWRAFQLAFILLNLDGIFQTEGDDKWEARNEWVDLVWFPTGGGKTEAYLGLIALSVINRRKIYKEKGGGVAVIMRYTLRLLTMQQFQRATLLIMALELMRRWGLYELGTEPISIGLWVGNDSLPNKLFHKENDRNKDSLLNEIQKLNGGKANKIPFSDCPWCGSAIQGEEILDVEDLQFRENQFFRNRLHLKCINQKCSFSYPTRRAKIRKNDQGPLPLSLSDETIYQHPPTLLFGTVDKFAQLAHKLPKNDTSNFENSDSRRLFGRGRWEDGKPDKGYLPPDLIIQDELHLLLGPLGSAVALFESAINQLCSRPDGTRPKIISSTATTRNTQLQIAALFDRKVNLFPKPGVESDDSYFAFYRREFKDKDKNGEQYLSKRKYIGILPTGKTQIWMQMRLASILMTHRAVFEIEQLGDANPIDHKAFEKEFIKAMDYYHTTISYFNSLKEVGKTQSQVQTYILKELRRVFNRVVRPQKLMHSIYTYGPIIESELTGRLSGEEVKNQLNEVETKWDPSKRFSHYQWEKDQDSGKLVQRLKSGRIPPEFVVATNMISVGIDVSRFNTIIMNSMPRNIAEYIQASSRVGRNDYGLVLTVHHPFRARDLSHYEKFIEFHEKMYSYVEPISITPFTKKSIERYMGLYLTTMIRHGNGSFVNRNSADNISKLTEQQITDLIDSLTQYFIERKDRLSKFDKKLHGLLKDADIVEIRKWIGEALDAWKELSNKSNANGIDLVFNNKSSIGQRKQEQLYVDIEEYENNIHSDKWQVPMSLRVIEPEAAIQINSN